LRKVVWRRRRGERERREGGEKGRAKRAKEGWLGCEAKLERKETESECVSE
jgi:hypothetical protein